MVAKRTTSRAVKRVAKSVTAVGASGGSAVTPLLDTYTGAAAAYSLRKLRTAYSGSAIRVRRSSDSAEQDIGFTAGGDLDESALTTFCDGGGGFVVTWYDQQGNNNATQATAANQPLVVEGGVIVKENLKPACKYNGTARLQSSAFSASLSQPVSTLAIYKSYNTADDRQIVFDGLLERFFLGADGNATEVSFDAGKPQVAGTLSVSPVISFCAYNTTSSVAYENGSLVGSGSVGLRTMDGVTIGDLRGAPTPIAGGYGLNGAIQELVIFDGDKLADRIGIEANVNSYWSVY